MGFIALLKSMYVEAPVADEAVWHKRLRAPLFARTVDGGRVAAHGQIWRRNIVGSGNIVRMKRPMKTTIVGNGDGNHATTASGPACVFSIDPAINTVRLYS